jgi:hypothetical protein
MSNVISLKDYKKEFDTKAYLDFLGNKSKIELLEEMVAYHEDVQLFGYTSNLRIRGTLLFTELLRVANTPELSTVCTEMLKFIEEQK